MAYILNYSGGTITVNDGTVNTDTSIQLPGRNFAGYGSFIDQNLVTMMQNFAGATNPSNAIRGQLWFDTGSNKLKYNVSATKGAPTWIEVAGTGSDIDPTFGDVTANSLITDTITTGGSAIPGTITGDWSFSSGSSISSQTYYLGNTSYTISSNTSAETVDFLVAGNSIASLSGTKFIVNGYVDSSSGSINAGVITGIDNGNVGGAGVSGIHTENISGLGIGVYAAATSNTFTGAVLQTSSIRPASTSFVQFRCYSAGNSVFVVDGAGNYAYDGTGSSPAADYAEYFEWEDGNPLQQDRVGYSVSLVGNKIKIAEEGDTVIGIISSNPAIVGDSAPLNWQGMYLTDEWGRIITEPYTVWKWQDANGLWQSVPSYDDTSNVPSDAIEFTTDANGKLLTRQVLNPDFDPSQPYVPRSERPEWAPVGLLGKLRVRKGQVLDPNWIKLRDINANVEEYLIK